MPVQYGGDRITFSDGSNLGSGWTGMKNRIINGDMQIDQRNSGASVTVNNTNLNYSVDRWWGTGKTSDGVYTMQRSASTPPIGFSNFLRITVTTADASIAAGDTYYMGTKIEGFNVADLGFGSANARTITVSFWARSSVTGTFSGALLNGAENRSYPFTFAINAANTWEYETITIAGDTTGTWATDNSAGMALALDLGSGSNFRATAGSWVAAGEYGATGAVTLISTLNATLDITGVQLERGSTATSFDYLPYGTELMLCQRYYYRLMGNSAYEGIGNGFAISYNSTNCQGPFVLPVKMRTSPSVSYSSNLKVSDVFSYSRSVSSMSISSVNNGTDCAYIDIVSSSLTSGRVHYLGADNSTSAFVAFAAEL
jgi:hypothetical protein